MNLPSSVQELLEAIDKLSPSNQAWLLARLQQQQQNQQFQESPQTVVLSKQEAEVDDNPWVRLAGKYQNDPDYDEVLAYIKQYRQELDAEMEVNYRQIEAEV
ncbi:MAG: hypothetical protein F6K47_19845 [Symploca sp. SIO2E6]|nr:hypothetical protein [Symploca sp. SIO2E6]